MANIFMNENNLNEPTNAQEGLKLFTELVKYVFRYEFKLAIIHTLMTFLPIRHFKKMKFCLNLIWQTIFIKYFTIFVGEIV